MLSSNLIRKIEKRDGRRNIRLRRLHNQLSGGQRIRRVYLSDGAITIPISYIPGDTLWSSASRAYIDAYEGVDNRRQARVHLYNQDGDRIVGSRRMTLDDHGNRITVQWTVNRITDYDPSSRRYTVYWHGFNAPTLEPLDNIDDTRAYRIYLDTEGINSAAEILASFSSAESSMVDS